MKNLCSEPLSALILCFLCGCYWFYSAYSETPKGPGSTTPCFKYDHCHSSKEGVQDLDCFLEVGKNKFKCVWNRGQYSSNQTYKLIIEQKARLTCKEYSSIQETFFLFHLYEKFNMTAYVVEKSDDGRNCTKAIFSGFPKHMGRCGPPELSYIKWNSKQLEMMASWKKLYYTHYVVQYKELNDLSWTKSPRIAKDENFRVANLTSTVFHEVQVRCDPKEKCTQCPWSVPYQIPPELNNRPLIDSLEVTPLANGTRMIIISWKLDRTESVDGYTVKVVKESGERSDSFNTASTVSAMRLILSGSGYSINIVAFNSAGTSPPAYRALLPVRDKALDGKINVTFNNNHSFNISWNINLTRPYCCYSVEWWRKGEKTLFYSFFIERESVITWKDPFQPYERYTFFLHMRPDKDTCNLKNVNNSEWTYGRTEAYLLEGTPISAPGNITCSSLSYSSLAINWSPVPVEDLRGFLLGYIIYYGENSQRNQSTINVNPSNNTYKLSNLKSHTAYKVQLSALTSAGEGVQSFPVYFNTKQPDSFTVGGATAGVLVGIMVLLIGFHLCFKWSKRATTIFWPSIPNPANSNAFQKINGAYDLDILEPINREMLIQVTESDTSSLHIMEERGDVPPPRGCHLGAQKTEELSPTLLGVEKESQATSMTSGGRGTASDYTTMALFHQAMSQPNAFHPPLAGVQASPEVSDWTRPQKNYIRQSFCPAVLPSDTSEGTDNVL